MGTGPEYKNNTFISILKKFGVAKDPLRAVLALPLYITVQRITLLIITWAYMASTT
jgi:hypothetical protein